MCNSFVKEQESHLTNVIVELVEEGIKVGHGLYILELLVRTS